MNIFHIPSWYPGEEHPYQGIFIKEYIEGFARNYPNSLHVISNQHAYHYEIILGRKKLKASAIQLVKFFSDKGAAERQHENITEYYLPKRLQYSPKFRYDLLKVLIRLHGMNFERALKKYKTISVIHAHVSYPGGIVAAAISKKYRVPYIITEHTGPFSPANLTSNAQEQHELIKALQEAEAVVSVSRSHARQVSAFTQSEVSVIPNLVNEAFFFPVQKKQTGETIKFLSISGFYEHSKGIPQLLNAMKDVVRINTGITLEIAGNDAQRPAMESLAEALNLQDRVIIGGKKSRSEIRTLLQECDVFILPSQGESFGVVYAEAIACGKPVIATACGGPEDIINQQNGILVPVDDENALKASILRMAETFRSYNADIIRQDFINRFSSKVIAKQYSDLYQSIINSSN